jgi:ornithine lipid ester-linked acyl 2-hydroxylase
MRKQIKSILKSGLDKTYLAARSTVEHLNTQFSLVGKGPFFHTDVFPWIAELESHWVSIRKELDVLLEKREEIPNFQDYSVRQRAITQDDKWKTYVLYFHGLKEEENCKKCPETLRVVEKIPGMTTAFFSILAPHKHLPEHRGPFNGVLRYHLGLMIPHEREQCRIRVGNDTAFWDEGKSLVFDDAYQHEVWNNSDSERVVLFVSFMRPLPLPFSVLNRLFYRLIRMSLIAPITKENHT